MSIALSRSHFKKGFDDTLLLKNLRQAVGLLKGDEPPIVAEPKSRPRQVVVVRTGRKTWNVKRAS